MGVAPEKPATTFPEPTRKSLSAFYCGGVAGRSSLIPTGYGAGVLLRVEHATVSIMAPSSISHYECGRRNSQTALFACPNRRSAEPANRHGTLACRFRNPSQRGLSRPRASSSILPFCAPGRSAFLILHRPFSMLVPATSGTLGSRNAHHLSRLSEENQEWHCEARP